MQRSFLGFRSLIGHLVQHPTPARCPALEILLHLAGLVVRGPGQAAGRAAIGAVDLLAGALVALEREVGVADRAAPVAGHGSGIGSAARGLERGSAEAGGSGCHATAASKPRVRTACRSAPTRSASQPGCAATSSSPSRAPSTST